MNTSPLLSRRALLGAGLAMTLPVSALSSAPADPKLDERLARAFGKDGVVPAKLDEMAKADKLRGVVAVARGDKVIFEKAYGLADQTTGELNTLETRFNLASMGKLLTALAVARLVERGKVAWSDPITRHVADLPPAFAAVTVDQLLTHRSGLGSYFSSPLYAQVKDHGRTVADYLAIVRTETPAPNSDYSYSNSGFVLLGALIETATGQDYYKAVETLVYQPAGMRRTGHVMRDQIGPGVARGYTNGCFARPPSVCTPGEPTLTTELPMRGTPAGGSYSTAGDLLKFERALRTGKLIKPATLAEMTRRHVDIARPGGPIDGYGYGFGLLKVGGQETFGHNGGTPGATSQIDMLASERLTLIVLANLDSAQRPVSSLLRKAVLTDG